jgi:hypothetical protein
MHKHNKQKIQLILVTALLLPVATPAVAQAPRMSQQALEMNLALQNPKQYAVKAIKAYGWDKPQFVCLSQLWGKESSWNYKADNPKSTAFGIAQVLGEKNKHPMLQINNGLRYIKHRYGKPCAAWQYWKRHFWY